MIAPKKPFKQQATRKHGEPPSTGSGYLRLCLAGSGGQRVSYAVCSIPKEHFRSDKLEYYINPLKENKIPKCLGMGSGYFGSQIIFFGGQEAQQIERGNDSAAFALPPYSLYEYSSDVTVWPDSIKFPSMLSGKASPLVLTVGDNLFVLAGTPVYIVPDPAFEKYDGSSWSPLPSPPFLDPNCNYFDDPCYCGYAVIDNWIHVSTSSSSFSFDTEDPKAGWTTCTLFGGKGKGKGKGKGIRGGVPFKFNGGAVLYDDMLICIDLLQGVVVAHKLDDKRKVGINHTQRLEELEIPTDAISACLADLGQGLFGLVSSCFDHDQNSESRISVMLFEVSKKDEKLTCEVLNKFPLSSIEQSSDNIIWSATSCFLLNNSTDKDTRLISPEEVGANRKVVREVCGRREAIRPLRKKSNQSDKTSAHKSKLAMPSNRLVAVPTTAAVAAQSFSSNRYRAAAAPAQSLNSNRYRAATAPAQSHIGNRYRAATVPVRTLSLRRSSSYSSIIQQQQIQSSNCDYPIPYLASWSSF